MILLLVGLIGGIFGVTACQVHRQHKRGLRGLRGISDFPMSRTYGYSTSDTMPLMSDSTDEDFNET